MYRAILHPDLRVYDFRTGHPQEYDREGLLASLGFDFDDVSLHKRARLVGSRAPRLGLAEHQLRGTWATSSGRYWFRTSGLCRVKARDSIARTPGIQRFPWSAADPD